MALLNPQLFLLLAPSVVVATECAPSLMHPERRAEWAALDRLRAARRMVVWLQDLQEPEVGRLDPDILVVDYSWDGSEARELTPVDVERLRRRPAGPPRIVLAYLSIGEAEDYRFYWPELSKNRGVLGPSNRAWRGNYLVRYWEPLWRRLVIRDARSYLNRILSQGFDGVFLDMVDAAEPWEARGVADAAARMADLVREIARSARAARPGFLVVAQNPFRILEEPGVLDSLSGISVESHLFPPGGKVAASQREAILRTLAKVRSKGRQVLAIEYPRTASERDRFFEVCEQNRLVCYAGTRRLDRAGWIPPTGPRKETDR